MTDDEQRSEPFLDRIFIALVFREAIVARVRLQTCELAVKPPDKHA
jgi:hypothetical protein